jgi:DmsE family decaheme c-type cytochrome
MIKRFIVTAAPVLGLGLCLLAAPATAQSGEPAPAYNEKGAEGCLKCHDKPPITYVLRTPHAMSADGRTPFADHACETCHGPSSEHLVKPEEGRPRATTAISFGRSSPNSVEEQNRVCQDCHSGGHQMNWQGSSHQFAELACTSCHQVHVRKDPVLVKREQADVCFACHIEQRAESHRPYRHPITEGLTTCSDCHNAHGSPTQPLLAGMTLNDTCYQCHAEKRGPFLFEHAPVQEDCTLCHRSHGSTERGLLKVRAPFLCQECHLAPYHSSSIYGGDRLSDPIGQRELLGRSCLSCHSQVHGSNHPSGVRAMR